jgi:hypothetical protein
MVQPATSDQAAPRDALHSIVQEPAWYFLTEGMRRSHLAEPNLRDPSPPPPPPSPRTDPSIAAAASGERLVKAGSSPATEAQSVAIGAVTAARTQVLSAVPAAPTSVVPLREPDLARGAGNDQALPGGVTAEQAAQLSEGSAAATGASQAQPSPAQGTADSPANGGPAGRLAVVAAARDGKDELPLPQDAGLIAEVSPFDRAALERAMDQFLERLGGLGVESLGQEGSVRVVPLSLAALGVVAALHAARRRSRRGGDPRHVTGRRCLPGSESLLGFPELPGGQAMRLT